MATILSLYLFALPTEASEPWVVQTHQLSQLGCGLSVPMGLRIEMFQSISLLK